MSPGRSKAYRQFFQRAHGCTCVLSYFTLVCGYFLYCLLDNSPTVLVGELIFCRELEKTLSCAIFIFRARYVNLEITRLNLLVGSITRRCVNKSSWNFGKILLWHRATFLQNFRALLNFLEFLRRKTKRVPPGSPSEEVTEAAEGRLGGRRARRKI